MVGDIDSNFVTSIDFIVTRRGRNRQEYGDACVEQRGCSAMRLIQGNANMMMNQHCPSYEKNSEL